jgi:hypothetical protein
VNHDTASGSANDQSGVRYKNFSGLDFIYRGLSEANDRVRTRKLFGDARMMLAADVDTLQVGDTVRLRTFGGVPQQAAGLWILAINAAQWTTLVALGGLDASGSWILSGPVNDPLLSGNSLTVGVFSIEAGGTIVSSNAETLCSLRAGNGLGGLLGVEPVLTASGPIAFDNDFTLSLAELCRHPRRPGLCLAGPRHPWTGRPDPAGLADGHCRAGRQRSGLDLEPHRRNLDP